MLSTANDVEMAQLSALRAVVEEGSFDRAAVRLHVTPSAISQRIKQLEVRVGQVVVQRSSPPTPTAAGQVLLRLAKQMAFLVDEAVAELSNSLAEPAAVAIAVNADSLATWFLGAIAPLSQQPERFLFELLVDDQEHTADMLRAGRVLAAVTAEPRPVQGCRVTTLGAMRYVAVATDTFMRAHFRRGVGAASLRLAPVLVFDRKDRLQTMIVEKLTGEALVAPTHWIPSSRGFVDAALAGIGWGTVPEAMALPYIESGLLRPVRRDATLDVPLFWQHWRLETDLMRALTESVVTAARSMNLPGSAQ